MHKLGLFVVILPIWTIFRFRSLLIYDDNRYVIFVVRYAEVGSNRKVNVLKLENFIVNTKENFSSGFRTQKRKNSIKKAHHSIAALKGLSF
jgi:hypothetical protein